MAKTRWLSKDEQQTWRIFVQATRMLMDQLEQELDEQTDVPSPYFGILGRLSEVPQGRLRMSDLAELCQSSRSRLSHSMSRLESLGWIRREDCHTDLRGTFAVLTDEGLTALKAAVPVHVNGVRTHFFDQLGRAHVKDLRKIIEPVLAHLLSVKGSSREAVGLEND